MKEIRGFQRLLWGPFFCFLVIHVEKSVIHVIFPTKRRKKCMMPYENKKGNPREEMNYEKKVFSSITGSNNGIYDGWMRK